jgi:class 3 adenylate cyclase
MEPAQVWSTSGGARAHPMQHPRIVTLLFTDVEGSTPLRAARAGYPAGFAR